MGAGHHHHGHDHSHSHGHDHQPSRRRPGLRAGDRAECGIRGGRSGRRVRQRLDGAACRCRAQPVRRAQPDARLGRQPARPAPAFERAYTYGLKSSSILAAIANAALIWLALGAILLESIRRLADPAPVAGTTMMLVAALGILVNGASAMLFAAGRARDINLRAAFQHLLADAAVSAGVVAAGLAVSLSGQQLDRSGDLAGHRRGDRLGQLGAAARFGADGPAGRARRDRRGRRFAISSPRRAG